MALSPNDREVVEAFRGFVEDSVSADDRYGTPSRHDRPDGGTFASRFHAGGACWFELAIRPSRNEVRVGFVTDDPVTNDGMLELIADAGQTMSEFVGAGVCEAGVDWPDPPVNHSEDQGFFYFTTSLTFEDIRDLDSDDFRDKSLRMLEGYLISFGPALLAENDPGDDDDDFDDE